MPGLDSRGIFISYRRKDSENSAQSLHDLLRTRIPDASVFMDEDDIEAGQDYTEVIPEVLGSCAVLLAVIGDKWATLTDDEGRRRLDAPDDLLCSEIQTALDRGIPVLPVLVDDTPMPGPELLPPGLQKLARHQARHLHSAGPYHRYDQDTLVDRIKKLLAEASSTGTGEQSPPTANVGAFTALHGVRPDGNALWTAAERTDRSPLIGGNNALGGVGIGGNNALSGASLAAGRALNAGTDELAEQVRLTELAAAVEQAQYQELQIESDANNAAASSVAQAAQHKMKTDSEIFKGFDQVISG